MIEYLLAGEFGKVGQSPEEMQAPGEWVGTKSGSGKSGTWEVVVAYRGPCILPWLWEDVVYDGEVVLRPQPITFRAGAEGKSFLEGQASVERQALVCKCLRLS